MKAIRTILLLVVIIIAAIILLKPRQPQKEPAPFEKISIGFYPANSIALLYVAENQGLFLKEGLSVTLKEYPTGKQALKGMYNGEVELAVVGDMALVFDSFEKEDFRILATVGSSENEFKIVANKEKVKGLEDFKNKRIATVKGTQMNFFMHLFLQKQGLSDNEVEISFMNAEDLPQALASGSIDAASTREPIISQAKRLLGERGVVFEEPGYFTATANLTGLNSFIQAKPQVLKRILKALLKAEAFIRSSPEETIKITADKLKVAESEVSRIWPEHNLAVSLSQSLILTLEDQAGWAIRKKLTDKQAVPNYLDFIYLDALEEVAPERVTIVR